MEQIELVIKMPKKAYDEIKFLENWNTIHIPNVEAVFNAIANGISLPKGHGRLILINEDTLNRWCIEGDGDDKFTEGYNFAMNVIKSYIAEEPTIIGADKEGEEDGNGK